MDRPPIAKRVPTVTSRAGGETTDDWAWLSDRQDPDTVAYLEAENRWADQWFEPLSPMIDTIFGEIRSRTQETDLSVPVVDGPWRYYARTLEGSSYPIHCRMPLDSEKEQVLLDENERSGDVDYFSLGLLDVSPSHRLLAWAADTDGGELHRLAFRDLDTDTDLADVVEDVYYGGAWSRDDRWFFYVTCDAAMRPYKVWRHRLGGEASADECIFTEDDERFYVNVGSTRSERFVVIESASKTTSEAWIVPADEPEMTPRVVVVRRDGHEYSLDHQGDRFVILTNEDAVDFRVVETPVDRPERANWREIVAHEPGRHLNDVSAFAGHLVLQAMDRATETLTIVDGTGARTLEFAEEVHSVNLGPNPDYDSTTLRFVYESMTTPSSVYDEDLRTGRRDLRKRQPVLGGVDLDEFVSRREWATSHDGALVPIDLVHHRSVSLDAGAPTLLYGYGSYEISVPPWFSIARLSLMQRGVVFALAHPRGGGEMGRQWYLDGKLLSKRNTFLDTIASAEHLVAQSIAAPGRIVLRGGSAGGLLVGACITMRPDLWAGAVAEVPFVDVVNTMSDASAPLTVTEWEEWGNPAEAPFGDYIAGYSPYDNVAAIDYPALYVTAGLNDPRVSYHEPAKWVARIRASSIGDRPVLLRTEMGAGHGGPSGRYNAWRDEARTLAFILWALGVAG